MKKLITICIVLVLLFALAAPAFCADNDLPSPSGGDGSGGGTVVPTTPSQGGTKSPQTGHSAALWSIGGIAMLLCAGACFAAARKNSIA